MTTERDELLTIIGEGIGAASMCWEHVEQAGIFDSNRAAKVLGGIVDSIDAAGYRKPRTIEDVESRDALPDGTVVMSNAGTMACKFDSSRGVLFGMQLPFPWKNLALPLTVLWEPQADCCTADGPTCATCAGYAAEDAEPRS